MRKTKQIKTLLANSAPDTHTVEWLREHGAELSDAEAVATLQDVFGVDLGDTIEVVFDPDQPLALHPRVWARADNTGTVYVRFQMSAVKQGSMYIDDGLAEWQGYSGSSRAGFFHFFVNSSRIYKVATVETVKSAPEIVQVLIDAGYVCNHVGDWEPPECTDKCYFVPAMWETCGKPKSSSRFNYEPEWLEEAVEKTLVFSKENAK